MSSLFRMIIHSMELHILLLKINRLEIQILLDSVSDTGKDINRIVKIQGFIFSGLIRMNMIQIFIHLSTKCKQLNVVQRSNLWFGLLPLIALKEMQLLQLQLMIWQS